MDKPKRVRKPKMGKLPSEASEPLEEKTDEPVAESEPQDTPEIQRMRGVGLQSLLELAPTTKQRKKLRMGEAFSTTSSETSVKRKPRPKMKAKPEESVREVVLPTHQEQEQEEVDVNDFDIEYVTVKVVEINGMEYFRDTKKNKLFRKIKEKSVGNYVGRYDPRTETILELPDSDCES
jgi:hypothetical protein